MHKTQKQQQNKPLMLFLGEKWSYITRKCSARKSQSLYGTVTKSSTLFSTVNKSQTVHVKWTLDIFRVHWKQKNKSIAI